MNVGEFIVRCLIKQGIRHIFGIPGNQLTPIFEAIYKNNDDIKFIDCRNESGASLMADGYAKSSGKVSVCMVSPGPGASNTYIGMLEGYTSCSPVLLITVKGKAEFDEKGEERLFHGLDHIEAFKPVTKWQYRVEKIEEIPYSIKKAFENLTSGRPGPVVLEFRSDLLVQDIDEELPDKYFFDNKKDNESNIQDVAEIISKSKNPVIIAGREVFSSKAENELLELAKKIYAPILTTTMGKGVVSDYEELALGSILNYNYENKLKDVFEKSDLCIAIGVRFTQVDTESWSMKINVPLVTISVDSKYLNRDYKSEKSLVGDIRLNLKCLLENVKDKKVDFNRKNTIRKFREEMDNINYPGLIRNFQEVMPLNSILVNDVHIEGFSYAHYKVRSCSNYIHSGLSLGIGYALPAAIGAKMAFPERKIVAFCGDGGFLMNSPELATIKRYGIDITIVIVNDGWFGTIKRKQQPYIHNIIGLNLYNPDFMKLAEAYNMQGFRVDDMQNFNSTLKKAIDIKEAVIVEVVKNW